MVSPPSPIGAALYRWRSAPEPTGGDPRSVRRLPGPFPVVVVPVRTSHRVSGSTCDGYSSRSQPVLRDVGAEYGRAPSDASSRRSRAGGGSSSGDGLEALAAQDRERRVARETGGSVRDRSHSRNALPRFEVTTRECRHVAHRPTRGSRTGAGGIGRLERSASLAERVGFEPTKSFDSALFKSAAINRSATSPWRRIPAGRRVPRRTSGGGGRCGGSLSPSVRRTNGSQASAPSDCASTARISSRPGTTSATLGTAISSDRPRSTSTGPRVTGCAGPSPALGPMVRFGTPPLGPPVPPVPSPCPRVRSRSATHAAVAVGDGRAVPPRSGSMAGDGVGVGCSGGPGRRGRRRASGSGGGRAGSAAG